MTHDAFYMQIEGELCAPCRDGENAGGGAPVAPTSFATSTPSEYGKQLIFIQID